MMKRKDSQETPITLQPPTYQSPDTVTPPNHVASTAMIPEFIYQNTVSSNTVLANPSMYNQSENDTLDHELRSKLSELFYQISKEELASPDDEPIRKVVDPRYDGERERKKERVIQRERENEAHKESNGKKEMERNKRKLERLSERWIQRQICRECVESDVVRQKHRERNQRREGSNEIKRQMEKQQEWDTQQKMAIQKQVETSWHVRQVDTESENEKKAEKEKLVETEQHTLTRVNGLCECERDLQGSEPQQVKIITEKAKEGGVDTKKRREITEAHSHRAPSDPEPQMSPTEVSKKNTKSRKSLPLPQFLKIHLS